MNERERLVELNPENKKENRSSRIRKPDLIQPSISSADRVLFLQRTIGNQAVERMIRSGTLQAKLRIGQPGEEYEEEADRVADQVMRMPDTCAPEDEERIQAKTTSNSNSEVDRGIENQMESMKGGGHPLSEGERAFIEPRFGYDFSNVRLHTDANAAEVALGLNAKAFAIGRDVAFGAGHYALGTVEGRKLLAHELAHVIQQRDFVSAGALQKKPDEITFEPEVITISAAEKSKLLKGAGWKQVNVIATIVDFMGEPMRGHRVFAEFKAPGVAPVVEGGDVTGGAMSWSGVWLKPEGTLRLMAVSTGEAAMAPEGVTFYQLPQKGPLKFKAMQKSTEVTVTAKTVEEAAKKVGAKGSIGVDYKIIKIGGEVSGEEATKKGEELALTWKVILPVAAFELTQVP